MHRYVELLRLYFEPHANPQNAVPMRRYMRDQFEYLGIKGTQMDELLKGYYTAYGLPEIGELDSIVRDLWLLPQREYQYIATGLISKFEKQLAPEFIGTLEYLIITKSWWDTVDTISTHGVGTHFKRYPKVRRKYLTKWRQSDNFWLRRACLLFQLNYKEETDFILLREIICENLDSKEFFINKAIGWALRQYTRVDPQGVRKFVAETPLSPLSAREALKWLEKRKSKEAI